MFSSDSKDNLSCSSFSISVHEYFVSLWIMVFEMIFQPRFSATSIEKLRYKKEINCKRKSSIKTREKVNWKFIHDCIKCRWPKSKILYTKVSIIIKTKKSFKINYQLRKCIAQGTHLWAAVTTQHPNHIGRSCFWASTSGSGLPHASQHHPASCLAPPFDAAHQPPQAQVVADFLLPLSYTLKNTESTNMHQSKQNQQKSSQHQH
jgi:hypothetical protein